MTTRSELRGAAEILESTVMPGGTVLCAVSGGLDSMCLLHYVAAWGQARGVPVTAAHFNHQLRPTADRDEAFVRDACAAWNVPLAVGRGDVEKLVKTEGLSVEEAARKLRYAFLRDGGGRAGRRLDSHRSQRRRQR